MESFRNSDDHKKMYEKFKLAFRTINELASGSTLFNVINIVDGEPFTGPIDADSFGKCGIVWFIPNPAKGQHDFEHQFCTAIGPKPQLEFDEKEDLDTDKISDDARYDLLQKISESVMRQIPSVPFAWMDNVRKGLQNTTTNRVPVCVVASYNVSSDDCITLLAYHPCIEPASALALWLERFSQQ